MAAADKVEQCPSAVSESVCQSHPKTMQLHIEEAAVSSARGKGKMSGKGMIRKSHAELVQLQHAGAQYTANHFTSHCFMKSNVVQTFSNFNYCVRHVVISLLYIALRQ
mgnify:FL=1